MFINDLKTYQESHELLCAVNEMLVKASKDTGACYGVNKCAEIVFQRGEDGDSRRDRGFAGRNEKFRPRPERNIQISWN